jgi:hypothetical protein
MAIALYIFSGATASLLVLLWGFSVFMLCEAIWWSLKVRISQRCNRNGRKK